VRLFASYRQVAAKIGLPEYAHLSGVSADDPREGGRMSHVDSQLAGLLKDIDLPTLGSRVRNARLARGLTQAEAAGEDASTAYISRIESGHRRPDARLLERIADRLDTTVEELLVGISADQRAEAVLTLDYAELALVSGDVKGALHRTAEALDLVEEGVLPDLRSRARHVRARALEAAGRLDDAILAFEDLVDSPVHDRVWLSSAIALCRCYRETGDLARSIETGEQALRHLDEYGLEGTDEAVQLAVTIAAAHFERGDVSHAVRQCQRAIERAEGLDSPKAKASAYWNASIMQSNQGAVDVAVPLAQKAIALLEIADDTRNLARLRSQLGISQLRLDPPAVGEAQRTLEQAARELEWSSASPADTARNQLALARVHQLAGDLSEASWQVAQVLEQAQEIPLLAAEAWVLRGQLAADVGDVEQATAGYRQAVLSLTAIGADRGAAQLWFELAGLLQEVGDAEGALDAYRRAAASTGLTSRRAARTLQH
jgi:tetratricopeptide (TPR) repeat protein